MNDCLKYRIPGGDVVVRSGAFEPFHWGDFTTGFFVQSFDSDTLFGFVEKEGDSHVSYGNEAPVVYSKEDYLKIADAYIEAFNTTEVDKAILSRVKSVEADTKADDLFEKLCALYPNAFVYFISSPLFGTWIGATPEVLLSLRNGAGTTMSLAGTKRSGEERSWSQKEIEEQAYVTQFIHQVLVDEDCAVIEMEGPKTVTAGPVEHLRTDFKFDINPSKQKSLIRALQPTPAVCGTPRNKALQLINEQEKHKRSLYTGIIGVLEEQESQVFVNLRCAQLFEDKYCIYVGGGLTKDSTPQDEWDETENKAKTLLNVLEKL